MTWKWTEAQELVYEFLEALGVPATYRPAVGHWSHSKCDAWNVQVKRRFINLSDEDMGARRQVVLDRMKDRMKDKIKEIILRKLADCRRGLESLTRFGPSTSGEEKETTRYLYDLWALSRAAEAMK